MSERKKEEFRKLVEKYLEGRATEEERIALERYYTLFESAPELSELLSKSELDILNDDLKQKINTRIRPEARPVYLRPYFRVAALIAVLLGTAWLIRINFRKETIQEIVVVQPKGGKEPVNRFLSLPDGSKVILHGDSRIEYNTQFNHTQRVVHLTGEAYFDVTHRDNLPFVIYTGKVKTTVLGTAFNIKAWPGQKNITVSVTRGKVRVEDEKNLIAVLTPDKQVVYNIESAVVPEEQHIESARSITWVQRDMTFDEMPFGELAGHLGTRYGVAIKFHNPELEKCPITGQFSGTETLEEVMRILSFTANTSYHLTEDGNVIIDGEKCM